ncbi:MAG: MMPL family transporter [Gaiellaceae bacterium]
MSPLKPSRNLAARMGRWSASHWKTATFGWLALVVAAVFVGGHVGTKNLDPQKSGSGESGRVDRISADEFKRNKQEMILIQSRTEVATDPAFVHTIQDATRTLAKLPIVVNVHSPLVGAYENQISSDRHSALVQFELNETDTTKAEKAVVPVEAAVAKLAARHPSLRVEQFGDASAKKALDAVFKHDLEKAGELSVPITLAILVAAFGALVAAGIPLLLALTAVFLTMGLVALPSHWIPLDQNVSAVILLVGLAVGVDYSMFYLKREREERAAGRSPEAALEAAAATSGRAVIVSGLTVMIAMAGMFFAGDATFKGFGLATILVVASAVLGSVTVLPALLSRLGDKVDKGRVPFVGRLTKGREGRFWNTVLDAVLKRPLVSLVVAAGLLLALAAPALNLHTTTPGAEAMSKSIPIIATYDRIQKAFPGDVIAANVLVKAQNVRTPKVQAAIASLEKQALATGRVHQPVDESINRAGTVEVVSLPIDGNGTNAASVAALNTLRQTVIPATIGKVASIETYGVSGQTAISKDFNDQMKSAVPIVFGFVLLLAFVLLLLTFRSVVIATKAIVLNLLSVAATFGAMTLIFQHGWGKGLLGFDYTGGIMAFLPIFMFVILFGLSMDYHVFILSRIREAYDRGMSSEEAVTHGIKSTAGVVTSAAIVMVAVFSIFGTISVIMLKQFGVGLAIAVFLDATIVRAVLLPSAMKLLGDWNWYLPRWLEWLPRLEHEPSVEAPPVPALS